MRIQLALALIIGGALGNVIDRLWLGKVIDFVLGVLGTVELVLPGVQRCR